MFMLYVSPTQNKSCLVMTFPVGHMRSTFKHSYFTCLSPYTGEDHIRSLCQEVLFQKYLGALGQS